uniref:Myozenin 1 n=1 Tax=Cyanoderma ruficeps TaxID=181631 RepID=A0A8C3R4K6_9PASS
MPLAGTPAPVKRKKSTKLIGKLTHEAMPQEASKLNLGKKISTPRDVMLEELSLLTNKGSKMFKLRQLRVEKFIYENNPDAFTDNSVDHFQKFIPPGGQYGEDAHGYAQGRMVGGMPAGQHGSGVHQHPGVPPRPGSRGGARDGEGEQAGKSSGGGGGGDGTDKDGKSGGKKVTIFKTYISPWERAMGISPEDKSQFSTDLLSYSPKHDFPHYKSFNRTAMPYGGYEKAAKRMTFKVPQFDICPLLPESLMIYNQNFSKRPSFNRTPIPWMPSGDFSEYQTAVNVPVCGETEEL